jgi:hypothetical protein
MHAPIPTNGNQLRSFLGIINYYGKFIPNLSALLHPLNSLLCAGKRWEWSPECDKAFKEAKNQLISAKVLTHFDPTQQITLAADASAYGIGAVISHVFSDGTERPIAFASRTLTASERNYAQLEKEALALIFGVKKFHRYLYGHRFTLITDHRPLTTILGPKKGIPSLAAARLQRWALILSAYQYSIQYKSTTNHGNADGLSRLPLPSTTSELSSSQEEGIAVFNIGQIQSLPVSFQEIKEITGRDKLLSKVLCFVRNGWPDQTPEELKPYKNREMELSVENGCLMWGMRVLVPEKLQPRVLQSLHVNHPGISKMKSIARSHFWWKGLDSDIELLAKECKACQANHNQPAITPLHPWIWPDAPWKRLHADFAGPFEGHMLFVLVDAHSKWPEVQIMKSTTAEKTIEVLRSVFARQGLPEQLVTDNGPQFISTEFKAFLKANGIKHILSAPYHPASNGLAERFIQTLKRTLKAGGKEGKTIHHRLTDFLFEYRATPHTTTNISPSELLMKRKLRTRFDLMSPLNTKGYVAGKQADQKIHHDKRTKFRSFLPGSLVMVREYNQSDKWIKGVIVKKLGPITYTVELTNGRLVKKHIDQLRECISTTPIEVTTIQDNYTYPTPMELTNTDTMEPSAVPTTSIPVEPSRRYPDRTRRPPDRYIHEGTTFYLQEREEM